MSDITFKFPDGTEQRLTNQLAQTKILSAAVKAKVKIRFGCASCRCGTCGIRVFQPEALLGMGPDEKALLERMGLDASTGLIRLACRAKLTGHDNLTVDLSFQDEYTPDGGTNHGAL